MVVTISIGRFVADQMQYNLEIVQISDRAII